MSDANISTLRPQTDDNRDTLAYRQTAALAAMVTPSIVTQNTIQTSASGANYQVLANIACESVILWNRSTVDIEVQRLGTGTSWPVESGSAYGFDGITNANQLGIRRIDQSNTQVTLNYETSKY